LATDALRRYFAEKFDAYLREGWLSIEIRTGVGRFPVAPPRITLPRLLTDLRELPLARDPTERVRLELYFDPSGRGRVAIRHHGVTIVDSLATVSAYGLEDSAWAAGFVRGVLDADFLTPLPARSGFDENEEWIGLLDLLDRYLPTLEAELEEHLRAHRARQASEIGERALRLARDILDLEEFRDLALPGGMAKRGRPEPPVGRPASRRSRHGRTAATDAAPGDRRTPRGRRIKYEEVPFDTGSTAHSRFVQGVVQANTLHPDFQDAARSTDSRLAYAALMIGKESIAFNDRSGPAGDYLEKLLDFYFKLQGRKRRASRRGSPQQEQDRLELAN
jgi:hypothetical protein